MTLRDLEIGQSCIVERVGGEGSLRQHFLDMGIIPGARVTLIKYAPMGNPMELRIHSYELTLRLADAEQIVIDGVFAGVGSVLSFMPIILVMFLFLSLLEDSGYLARVAFFMDKPLRRIGLSGRSIVPMLVGFGCTVPAVMSTRTLPSDRDRRMTILLTPFMSCTAKLPIYAFFVASFFPGQGGLVMTLLYLLGIGLGILVAHFYNRTIFKGDPTHS